jgi:hypothetical protein
MNEARLLRLLNGHTGTAQRIFMAVPIQEAWPLTAIHSALMKEGSITANIHTIKGSLLDLRDNGLIKETKPGFFQRQAINVKTKKQEGTEEMALQATAPANPVLKASDLNAVQKSVAANTTQPSAIDMLAELSKEVLVFAEDTTARLKKLAGKMEDIALVVGSELESSAEAAATLKQLQTLLKGIA